jgi:hypothetical protein
MYASDLSFLGIAKETTRGTGVVSTDFIPVDPSSLAPKDVVVYLEDSGLRASQVDLYDVQQGVTFSEYGFGGDVFPDTLGFILSGLTGDVATSGASAPFTHTFSVKNSGDGQPTSFTLSDNDGAQSRQFAGMQFSDLGLKFSADGTLSYDTKAMGNLSSTISAPTKSFASTIIQPAWRTIVTIGGSGVVTVVEGSLDLKRKVTAVHTLDGTANPYRIWVGPLQVSGKLKFVQEDESELTRYLTNTKPSLQIDLSQGAGSTATQCKFLMTKAAYVEAGKVRGKDWMEIDVNFKALANTTDVGASGGYSPIKATLQNAKAAASYV